MIKKITPNLQNKTGISLHKICKHKRITVTPAILEKCTAETKKEIQNIPTNRHNSTGALFFDLNIPNNIAVQAKRNVELIYPNINPLSDNYIILVNQEIKNIMNYKKI